MATLREGYGTLIPVTSDATSDLQPWEDLSSRSAAVGGPEVTLNAIRMRKNDAEQQELQSSTFSTCPSLIQIL